MGIHDKRQKRMSTRQSRNVRALFNIIADKYKLGCSNAILRGHGLPEQDIRMLRRALGYLDISIDEGTESEYTRDEPNIPSRSAPRVQLIKITTFKFTGKIV